MLLDGINANIWLDVCGVIVILTIIALHYLRHTLPLRQNAIYMAILICVGITCLTNIISVVTPNHALVAEITNDLTVYFGISVGALWVAYISIVVNVDVTAKRRWKALFIPLGLVALGLLINHFIPLFFEIRPDGMIDHGPLYGVLMACYALYFVTGIYIVLSSRHYLSRERFLLFIPFILLGVFGGLADVFFPEWRMLRFCLVLCSLLYYFSLQNPDEYYDEDSPMFNEFAFEQLYRARLDEGKNIRCIAIYIRQLEYLSSVLDADNFYDMQQRGMNRLRRRARNCMMFRFSGGRYLVVVTSDKMKYAKKVYSDIRMSLDELGETMPKNIPFKSSMLAFECPRDVFSITGLQNLMRHFVIEAGRSKKDDLTTEELGIKSEGEERKLEREIRDALRERRLEVYYQPIYAPLEKKYTSAEALVRMRDKEGNFVSPGIFIPAAERNGLVIEISDYVLDEVVKTMKEGKLWEQGMEYVEVNLSVTECLQTDLVDRVMGTLTKYDLDPKHINLEITETASDAFSKTLDDNIRELHSLGLEFSLDDFGTGYSSLNRILDLPLNLIKLDITLVRPAFEPGNDDAYSLLECAVDIAKGVGTSIVAEGVETKEMAEGVIDLGVDHIQGYYYSKPLPKDEFLALVAAQ